MTDLAAQIFAATEATWPSAAHWQDGPFTYRDGQGGGKRVSAASAEGPVTAAEVAQAVQKTGLFMLRPDQPDLDALLAAQGLRIIDPVVQYCAPVGHLLAPPIPPVTAFEIWEPLAIMQEIWAAGGIGPARLAVMDRAKTKTAIFGRADMRPAGVAFAAVHEKICMVHAVEVLPRARRQGLAGWMMRRAAHWAAEQGATQIAVLCVEQNAPANALYQALGFQPVGRYHYRTSD